MNKISFIAISVIATVIVGVTSCGTKKAISTDQAAPEIYNLASEIDSVSYTLGKASAYHMIKQTKVNLESWPEKGNYEAFIAGVNDAVKNPGDSLFLGRDIESINEYFNNFFQTMSQKIAEKNKIEGEKFLTENKTKDGVITTESGLQYKIITEGTGAKPKAENEVKVHYRGKLLDGSVFDSSFDRGEPVSFPLSNVISGWTEGLQLMPVGSKFILWIPSELGYGERPPSQDIKPNSLLEFEIELLDIVK